MARVAIHLVWLKRDLRLLDHLPIFQATQSGPTVVLYVFEPKLWAMPEMDRSHFDFIVQSLEELSRRLLTIGGRLAIRIGELPHVFADIARDHDIARLYSHEETGNGFTYDRDRRVAKWARQSGIAWLQFAQNGVVRPLRNRNGWAELWRKRMTAPITPTPTRMVVPTEFDWGRMPNGEELGLASTSKTNLQVGGESKAQQTLESFLTIRGANYRKGMSSPELPPTTVVDLAPI